MKLKTFIQTAAVAALMIGTASAGWAQEAAPENRPSDTMDRDGGPTDLDMKVYQNQLPPYVGAPYAMNRSANENSAYAEYPNR
jgi:hypothetical protein